jgi:DNA-binding response OmpR family regulator
LAGQIAAMSGPDTQVLVVIQEALLAGAISRALQDAGYTPHWAENGESALDMAAHRPYAVFIVELVLPDMLGAQLVRALRSWGRCAPVLLLGGLAVPESPGHLPDPTIARLPKPITTDELVSRVAGLLGPKSASPLLDSATSPAPTGRLAYKWLEIDPETHAASRDGQSIILTDREYAVLDCLMRHPEEVISKEELTRAVWGSDEGSRSNVLEVYINFLRRKIDRGFDHKLLHTVRGAGYVLRAG